MDIESSTNNSNIVNIKVSNDTEYKELLIKLNQFTLNNKIFSISNNFHMKNIKLSYNINEIFNTVDNINNTKEGIILSKRIKNTNKFLSVISNYEIHLNEVSKDGINFIRAYKGHEQRINDIVILDTYPVFVSGSEDGKLKIWSLEENKKLKEFKLEHSELTSLACYNEYLFAGTGKGGLNVFNLKTMKKVSSKRIHSERISNITVCRGVEGSDYLITCGEDSLCNLIILDDIASFIKEAELPDDIIISTINMSQNMIKADLLGNSKYFLYGSNSDESLSIFNLEKNTELLKFDAKNDYLGINYIADFISIESGNRIKLNVGSYDGAVVECILNASNKTVSIESILQTNVEQRISSILDFDSITVMCTDEGFYYIL